MRTRSGSVWPKRRDVETCRAVETLVIDEINMVRSDLFCSLEAVFRQTGNPSRPFGGKQVIALGDFKQRIPYVHNLDLRAFLKYHFGGRLAFQCRAWCKAHFKAHILDADFYGKDKEFGMFLHELHEGRLDTDAAGRIEVNANTSDVIQNDRRRICVCLDSERKYNINEDCVKMLGSPMILKGSRDGKYNVIPSPVDDPLMLKEGCKLLMLPDDMDIESNDRHINDMTGILLAKEHDKLIVRSEDGDEHCLKPRTWTHWTYDLDIVNGKPYIVQKPDGNFTQYPVQPAYALYINDVQGFTLDSGYIILANAGCIGQGKIYTALSSVRSFHEIMLNRKLTPEDVRLDPAVEDFYSGLKR